MARNAPAGPDTVATLGSFEVSGVDYDPQAGNEEFSKSAVL
jgi:hypothetical protein